MEEQKKSYYIDVGTGAISQSATSSTWSYKVQATEEEIMNLRKLFNQNYDTEWKNFFRSHVPFLEYHHDRENDEYDSRIQQIYYMLHQLGDQETKTHIESMNILPNQG